MEGDAVTINFDAIDEGSLQLTHLAEIVPAVAEALGLCEPELMADLNQATNLDWEGNPNGSYLWLLQSGGQFHDRIKTALEGMYERGVLSGQGPCKLGPNMIEDGKRVFDEVMGMPKQKRGQFLKIIGKNERNVISVPYGLFDVLKTFFELSPSGLERFIENLNDVADKSDLVACGDPYKLEGKARIMLGLADKDNADRWKGHGYGCSEFRYSSWGRRSEGRWLIETYEKSDDFGKRMVRFANELVGKIFANEEVFGPDFDLEMLEKLLDKFVRFTPDFVKNMKNYDHQTCPHWYQFYELCDTIELLFITFDKMLHWKGSLCKSLCRQDEVSDVFRDKCFEVFDAALERVRAKKVEEEDFKAEFMKDDSVAALAEITSLYPEMAADEELLVSNKDMQAYINLRRQCRGEAEAFARMYLKPICATPADLCGLCSAIDGVLKPYNFDKDGVMKLITSTCRSDFLLEEDGMRWFTFIVELYSRQTDAVYELCKALNGHSEQKGLEGLANKLGSFENVELCVEQIVRMKSARLTIEKIRETIQGTMFGGAIEKVPGCVQMAIANGIGESSDAIW